MKRFFRLLFVASALLGLASCDKPAAPPVSTAPQAVQDLAETQLMLNEARDALQRQALEIDTKSALMGKQLADMEKALADRENDELRGSLDALKKQNDDLRAQADAARRQSSVITQRIAAIAPPAEVTPQIDAPRDHSLFYEGLSPYGHWTDVSGYGYCWSPTVHSPSWRPYVDGCWVWTSLGWTWQSNEPYGWAVYHYGRWVNLSHHGWVWVPGDEWAPAWVAWRQSRDYVGWAPLPPDRRPWSGVYRDCDSHYNLGPTSYTFITTNHFVRPSYTTVCAPVTRNTTIYQSSVNVTQIVRRESHPHGNVFVHHGGPPRAQIEKACGAPVPQRRVHVAAPGAFPPHPEHRHDAREAVPQLEIVELPAARGDAPPVRPKIKEHIGKPEVVSGFAGVPERAASEIRETIAGEEASAAVQRRPEIATAPGEIVSRLADTPAGAKDAPAVTAPGQRIVRPAVVLRDTEPVEVISPPMVTPQAAEATSPVLPDAPAAATETIAVTVPDPVGTVMTVPAASIPSDPAIVESGVPASDLPPAVPTDAPAVEVIKPEPPVMAAVPATKPEDTTQAPAASDPVPIPLGQPEAAPQPAAAGVSQQAIAEKMAAEQATAANAAAEAQERLLAEKMTIGQATAAAEAETARIQAVAQQQEALAAQQRMAAQQAAAEAEAEAARRHAEAVAMQQQQPQQPQLQQDPAAQQSAALERMAAEQAAAEAERVRQQAEAAAAMQMRLAQQEAERRAQEMARRQAEEAARRAAEEEARRQAEAEMRRAQEEAQRAAQEMAQRQAEEQARRAQEEAQRQAAEAARRAQEEAQRAAEEAARRAAEEAARNQPPPGS